MEFVVLALPGVVGILFAARLCRQQCRTLAERFMSMFLTVISAFLLLDAYTVYPLAYSQAKVLCLIGNAFFAPCIGISICFVCWSLHSERQEYRRYFLALFSFSFIVFIAELLNYIGFGLQRAADYYANDCQFPEACKTDTFLYHIYGTFRFVARDVYSLVSLVSFVISLAFMFYMCYKSDFGPRVLFNFLFRRGPLRILHVLMFAGLPTYIFTAVRIYWGSSYMVKHPEETMCLYLFALLCVVLVGIVSMNLRKPAVYLLRPHRQPVYDDLPVRIFNPETLQPVDEKEESKALDKDDDDSPYKTSDIHDNLHQIMKDRAPYLFPGQSRYCVSESMGLRRDALDRFMHNLYHISYLEYVMVQRVEYCRRYRDRFNNESEVEISMACGFVSLKEMQYEWRECRTYFRMADKLIEEQNTETNKN